MARTFRRHKTPVIAFNPISPKVISVSATIKFNGDMRNRFGYMEKCFACGYSPLIEIKDESMAMVVKRYCSGCNTEWTR